jgi:hypothetical protein
VVEFDPEWEYYNPDPEVNEIVYSRKVNDFGVVFTRDKSKKANHGFRFGNGNPNYCSFRMGREKKGYRTIQLEDKNCPKCSRLFTPSRRSQVACSKRCGCGAPKVLPSTVSCKECCKEFRPIWSGNIYCSMSCAGKGIAKRNPHHIPSNFADMYNSGMPMKLMVSEFGVTKCTIKRWRSKLELQSRKSGNHSRKRRQ